MSTCPIWQPPAAITRTALLKPRCGWWSRTACLTDPHRSTYGESTACLFLSPRFRIGSRTGEKKAQEQLESELEKVLSEFSGYIAADELYDGPYCVLVIVDNRTYKRLIYEVLDHDPTHDDMRAFFGRFKALLDARGLTLKGITTDASDPEPIKSIFGDIPHQICEFHIISELNKCVLKAVAQVRKELKATMPKLGRGRPSKRKKKISRRSQRIQKKVADLFAHRHLFVKHHLTKGEKQTLSRITRGLPHLRKLRQIMDEVYRLFDRRCRMDTALEKLRELRSRVRRFKNVGKALGKLFSANLEKALTFLDDSLLPSTSNAVERSNRRYRKMQKTIYSVRTQGQIVTRIALDMIREAYTQSREQTLATLHRARATQAIEPRAG